jgi:large subunit ribosomal protein L31
MQAGTFGRPQAFRPRLVIRQLPGRLDDTTRLRFTPRICSATRRPAPKGPIGMKTGIHPDYVVTQVTCSCGNSFTTRSTAKSGSLHADVCSACHPFYTGKQKIMDVGGRVDKFEKRYGKRVRNSADN